MANTRRYPPGGDSDEPLVAQMFVPHHKASTPPSILAEHQQLGVRLYCCVSQQCCCRTNASAVLGGQRLVSAFQVPFLISKLYFPFLTSCGDAQAVARHRVALSFHQIPISPPCCRKKGTIDI